MAEFTTTPASPTTPIKQKNLNPFDVKKRPK